MERRTLRVVRTSRMNEWTLTEPSLASKVTSPVVFEQNLLKSSAKRS